AVTSVANQESTALHAYCSLAEHQIRSGKAVSVQSVRSVCVVPSKAVDLSHPSPLPGVPRNVLHSPVAITCPDCQWARPYRLRYSSCEYSVSATATIIET